MKVTTLKKKNLKLADKDLQVSIFYYQSHSRSIWWLWFKKSKPGSTREPQQNVLKGQNNQ